MAFSTSTVARWTILSSSAVTPSGLCRPSAFGMYTLRTGFARYAPRFSLSAEVLEIPLQWLAVVPPRLSVHAWRSFLLQSEVSHPQRFPVVDVVQKRGEPQLLILSCCLTYLLQLTRRVFPALCPGRVLLAQVPFGQTPSLHLLRRRLSGFVRRLPRYLGLSDFPCSFIIGVRP